MSLPQPAPKPPLAINMTLADPKQEHIFGLAKNPAKVNNPFYQATELDKLGKHKEAEKIYAELLNADFDNPVVLAALGMNYATVERNGLGALCLLKALDGVADMIPAFKRLGIQPRSEDAKTLETFYATKRSEIMNGIGTCYKHENKVDVAREYFMKAQEGIALNADIQNNLATLYINEGKPLKALEHLDLAISLQPGHPQAQWNKSLAHLELGEYAKGWAMYDAGFAAKVRAQRNYSSADLPEWDGSPGKTVVLYGEQGIGDEILFASCVPDAIAISKKVVIDCHKKLHTLFATSFPGVDIYPTREDEVITWPMDAKGQPRYAFDARCAFGSLPRLFRPDIESFPGTPYIKPSIEAEATWAVRLNELSSRPKIGISWAGGHKRTRIEVRSIGLEKLLPIFQQDADFISLQYTPCEDDIAMMKAKHGVTIHHWPEAVYSPNYADTAALVANLDLVITVCTSMVHLAGSMGVPTWVLTPSRPAWRYRLDLDTMPWYGNSITLFRQAPDTFDWEPVIAEVADKVRELLGAIK